MTQNYTAPLKAKSISITLPPRAIKPKTKATHEGVEVVELFAKHIDIPQKGRYGFPFHLGKIKQCGITLYHAERIIRIMLDRKQRKGKVVTLITGFIGACCGGFGGSFLFGFVPSSIPTKSTK